MAAETYFSRFKQNSFWPITILIILSVLIIDVANWTDPALAIYGVCAFIETLCALGFADWWRVKGSASSIYKWLTLLLFSMALNDWFQFYTRWVWFYENSAYEPLIVSVGWEYRSMLKLLALVYLLHFAIRQRFGLRSTYYDGIRQDMANGFNSLDAKIVAGTLRFEGHSHEGLVVNAKIIIKNGGKE